MSAKPKPSLVVRDKQLHWDENFIEKLKNVAAIPHGDKLKMQPFPDTLTLATLAQLVYNDDQSERRTKLPDGWHLLTVAKRKRYVIGGYFGAAYFNPSQLQIVISHRGTCLTNISALFTDFKSILFNNYTSWINSAVTFTFQVQKALNEVAKSSDLRYQLSITGHSLGGWLAQVSAFAVKYLQEDNDDFSRRGDTEFGIHAHTVVFENPGCKPILDKLIKFYDYRYDRTMHPNKLDMTCYVSAPNAINTCNLHYGDLYRIVVDLSKHSTNILTYDVTTHNIANMVEAIEKESRVEHIRSWPASWSERRLAFQEAKQKNNFHKQSQPGVLDADHYSTEVVDEKKCSLRRFSEGEMNILLTSQELSRSITKQRLVEMFPGSVEYSELCRFTHIDLDKASIACRSKEALNDVVKYTKLLVRWFPKDVNLTVKSLLQDMPSVTQAMLQLQSEIYCATYNDKLSKLDFRIPNELEEFLSFGIANSLTIQTEDCEFEMIRLFNVLEQKGISRYVSDHNKKACFLDLAQLTELEKLVDLKRVFESVYLLVVDCKNMAESGKNIIENVCKDCNVKIILLTSSLVEFSHPIVKFSVQFTDLTRDAQRSFLKEKNIYSQGVWISFEDILGTEGIDDENVLNNIIDSTKLKDVVTSGMTTLNIGTDLPKMSDLTVTFIKPNLVTVNLQNLIWYVSELRKGINLSYILLSGHVPENDLLKLREHATDGVEIVTECENPLQTFKKLCSENAESKISWFQRVADDGYEIKNMYDLNLYMKRKFVHKIGISIEAIAKRHKEYTNKEQFIFENVADKELILRHFNEKHRSQIVFMDGKDERNSFIENLINKNKNTSIHIFQCDAEDERHLVWVESVGILDGIRHLIDYDEGEKNISSEEGLFEGERKVIVVADEPGMGKSTSLTSVSRYIRDSIIIRIDFKDYKTPIKELPFDVTLDAAVRFISTCPDKTEIKLLTHCLTCTSSRPVHVLFDGFDEIQEEYLGEIIKKCQQEKVLRLLRFLKEKTTAKVCVTTRHYTKKLLENELSVFATKFKHIDEECQKEYIARSWCSRLFVEGRGNAVKDLMRLKKCSQDLYTEASKILGEGIILFMGIPMQMRMIVEVSMGHASESIASHKEISINLLFDNIFDLYVRFIETKYDIYLKDKSGISSGLTAVSRGWLERVLTKLHQSLGFREIFPGHADTFKVTQPGADDISELNRVGLVQTSRGEKTEFIHRTFAEYFSAGLLVGWLGKTCRSSRLAGAEDFFMSVVLLDPFLKVCRQFIDNQICNLNIQIQSMLASDALNYVDEQRQTALHVAITENSENIVDFLLSSLKDDEISDKYISYVTQRDCNGKTALFIAAAKRSENYINKFLNDVSGDVQRTLVLCTVCQIFKDDELADIDFLLECMHEMPCWRLERPHMIAMQDSIKSFYNAVKSGKIGEARQLWDKSNDRVEQSFFLNAADAKGYTALHHAAKSGRYDLIEFLVSRGADVNAVDKTAMAPLVCLLESPCRNETKDTIFEAFKYLIEKGADVLHEDVYNVTCFTLAAKHGFKEIVVHLLTHKQLLHTSDVNRITPFQHAAKSHHLDIVKIIWENANGVDVNYKDKFGLTALCWVAQKQGRSDPAELLSFLMGIGADVDCLDRYERSALQIAIKASNWPVAKFLVQHGAELDSQDWHGVTGLLRAARAGKWDFVQTLLANGANAAIEDNQGVSPLQIALSADKKTIALLMLSRGAKSDKLDDENVDKLVNYLLKDPGESLQNICSIQSRDNFHVLTLLVERARKKWSYAMYDRLTEMYLEVKDLLNFSNSQTMSIGHVKNINKF